MRAQFSRFGQAKKTQRDRLLVYGGSSFVFCAVVIGALLFASRETEARPDNNFQRTIEEPSQVNFGTVTLIAPAEQVAEGTKLSNVKLREIYWPRDRVPEGAVRSLTDVQETFAKVTLPADQPILRANVTNTPRSVGIEVSLPPGYRAVTIEVDAVSGVEGWATAGAHVDLFLTYQDREDGSNKTRVAVEDAIVLSYSGKTNTGNQEPGERIGRTLGTTTTVTLAVSSDEAMKIMTARAMGRLTLALRNPEDTRGNGDMVFSDVDFEPGRAKKPEKSTGPSAEGFVKFSNPDGKENTLIMGKDGKLSRVQNDDEE